MKKPQLHTSEAVAFVLRLAVSETLSATPLLVSLTQGDNSFYIFLPCYNPYNISPLF